MNDWTITFDGLTEPRNPGGTSAFGWTIDVDGKRMWTGKKSIAAKPSNTNNVAEYTALGMGLAMAKNMKETVGAECSSILIRGDSQLVINQIKGIWQVKAEHLGAYRCRCLEILKEIGVPWTAEWIPREQNKDADNLSREAYFEATGKCAPERGKKLT